MSQAGVSGRKKTKKMGRRGKIAPGRVVRRQERKDPRIYIIRLPELAAAGIKIVKVPRNSGVDISLEIDLYC